MKKGRGWWMEEGRGKKDNSWRRKEEGGGRWEAGLREDGGGKVEQREEEAVQLQDMFPYRPYSIVSHRVISYRIVLCIIHTVHRERRSRIGRIARRRRRSPGKASATGRGTWRGGLDTGAG